jgi:hypothetical protein
MRVSAPIWIALGVAVASVSQPTVAFVPATTSSGARAIYEPLRGARIYDTRKAGGALAGATTRTIQVSGLGGVAADATAAAVTITVVGPTKTGYAVAWPAGQTRPSVYTVQFKAGQTVSNTIAVKLSPTGTMSLYLTAGTAHVVVDVTGYYRGHDHDDRYLTDAEVDQKIDAARTTPLLGVPTGALIVHGAYVMDRDAFHTDVTLEPGTSINTNGFRLFVTGTLTMGNGSRIFRDGNPGTVTAAGGALAPATLGGGGAGTCSVPSPQVTNSYGGRGNNGGAAGGETFPPPNAAGGYGIFRWAPQALLGRSLEGELLNGGGGGGGGTCGAGQPVGGGGSGGGVVVVAARRVVVDGAASITARGGAAEKAGGGGGGFVLLASLYPKPDNLTLSASGGVSGGSVSFNGLPGLTFFLPL